MGKHAYVGGICGFSGDDNNITSCHVEGSSSISGEGDYCIIGGICGENSSGSVTSCYVEGSSSITGEGDYSYIGGICGYWFGDNLSSCYVKDSMISNTSDYGETGGICGKGDSGNISASYFYDSDNTHISIDGNECRKGYLVSLNNMTISDCFTNLNVDESTLVGYNFGTVERCYPNVGDKDTFTGKSWSDGAWSAYTINDTNWPPVLNQN